MEETGDSRALDLGTIRTVHHFAASGGTIMSKALAVQPEVVLLSEVSPKVLTVRFNPFDPVEQFLAGPRKRFADRFDSLGSGPDLAIAVFAERIEWLHDKCTEAGLILVLRDHSHSDFMGKSFHQGSTLLKALERIGRAHESIVTVRNPIESFLSARNRKWVHHAPAIEPYCKRLLAMLEDFTSDRTFLYEDFCVDPKDVTRRMCDRLALPFDPDFMSEIPNIRLTGDSGRKGDEISVRAPKPVPEDIYRQVCESPSFSTLSERFGYKLIAPNR